MQRILIADDDHELRTGVADLLATLGLEVLQAETGLEALDLARSRAVHAALLDWNMPLCTGLELLPRLHGLYRGLPCILYSGNLTSGMEGVALRAGAFAVMRKPVQPALLRSEVQRALAAYEEILRRDLPTRSDTDLN